LTGWSDEVADAGELDDAVETLLDFTSRQTEHDAVMTTFSRPVISG